MTIMSNFKDMFNDRNINTNINPPIQHVSGGYSRSPHERRMSSTSLPPSLMPCVAMIVSSYIQNKKEMEARDIIDFTQKMFRCLKDLQEGKSSQKGSSPAVPIEDSIKEDYLVCLEDGMKLKMMKRHLRVTYNMTPSQYRERWELPSNYPMVSPNYSKKRKKIAKAHGLGLHKKKAS